MTGLSGLQAVQSAKPEGYKRPSIHCDLAEPYRIQPGGAGGTRYRLRPVLSLRPTPRSDPLDRWYGPDPGSGPEVLEDRNFRTCSGRYRPKCRSANMRPAIETLMNTAELAQHRLLVEDNADMPSWGANSA